jgi:spermidine/putrescine transport system ATP-binding protein
MVTEDATASHDVPAVELIGVTKRFGEATAVDDMTLTVGENTFFALLGPSGCGKTTTLRMAGGFEDPTAGIIRLHGEEVTNLKPYRRLVNTVFQSYALFPHLSVGKNVAFGLQQRKVDGVEIKRRVGEMLDLVQLGDFADRKPHQLSGGQRQRVALARALINHPRVLLLDEPLGALDLKLRKEMQIELKRIQSEVGITFIHVTHDQEEAMTMADTIAVMNMGRIERLGAPTDIYDDPRSSFVANFLGASNLMEVTVVDASSGVVAMADGTRLRTTSTSLLAGGATAKVGVRPEKVRLAAAGAPGLGENAIEADITDAAFIGVSTQYLLRTTVGTVLNVVVQNVEGGRFAPGDRVIAAWSPQHTFVVQGDIGAGEGV